MSDVKLPEGRPILVAYLTLGYPEPETTPRLARAIVEAGADAIELGVPPNFAKYDGPSIRRSYEAAREHGVRDTETAARIISRVKDELEDKVPIIVLSYLDEAISNLTNFLSMVRDAEADAVLFPDLLIDHFEDSKRVVEAIKGEGLSPILFVSSSMPDLVISEAAEMTEGFLYVGLRPATGIPLPVGVSETVERVRALTPHTRIVVGFGLRGHDDVNEAIEAKADGVAIGSMIIEALKSPEKPAAAVAEVVSKYRRWMEVEDPV